MKQTGTLSMNGGLGKSGTRSTIGKTSDNATGKCISCGIVVLYNFVIIKNDYFIDLK